MTKIMSFDLSTKCIGCVSCAISNETLIAFYSAPIIPPQFNASELGFLKTKKKLSCGIETINSWAKPGEKKITKQEKKKRDVFVREHKDVFVLAYISRKIEELISVVNPDIVVVEKNEIFNGVLTSVLLGRVNGVLHGICGPKNIPVYEYHVQDVRKPYNLMERTAEFISGKTSEELSKIPDITKRVIREMMERIYSTTFLSDDESDACIVLDYHLKYAPKR